MGPDLYTDSFVYMLFLSSTITIVIHLSWTYYTLSRWVCSPFCPSKSVNSSYPASPCLLLALYSNDGSSSRIPAPSWPLTCFELLVKRGIFDFAFFLKLLWLKGSNETDVEGVPPQRCLTNAGRLGMEETIRPIVCSVRLLKANVSVWGYWAYSRKSEKVAYLSSDNTMMMMVWLGFLASGTW